MLEQTSDENERELILKSMGNLGHRRLIATLQTVVDDDRMSERTHLNAIYALMRLAYTFPKQVCSPLPLVTGLSPSSS